MEFDHFVAVEDLLSTAEALPDTAVQTIYEYWNGITKNPTLKTRKALAKALGVDVAEIPG